MNKNKIHIIIGLAIIIISGLGCIASNSTDIERTPVPMVAIVDISEHDLVQNDIYRIKIVNASKMDYIETSTLIYYPKFPDYVLLEVQVEFFENSIKINNSILEVERKKEILNLSMTYNKSNIYSNPDRLLERSDYEKGAVTNRETFVYYSVPKNSTNFKFKYRNSSIMMTWNDYTIKNK